MFSVYFIMQMSNGCRLTWFKWVNSIFLFTLIIQTATKKKKEKSLANEAKESPSSHPNPSQQHSSRAAGLTEQAGCWHPGGAAARPWRVQPDSPVPRMILVSHSSAGAACWQTGRSGSAELALGTGTGGCAAQPGGLPVDVVLAARRPLPKGHCQNSCWRQRGQTGPLVANRSSSALPHGKVSCRAGQAARPGRLSKPQEAKKQPQPGRRLEILKPRASLASPPTDTGKLRDSNLEELTSCSQQPGGGSQSESEWQWYPHRRWAFISFHKCQTQKGAFFCGRERVIGCSAFPT